MMESDCQLTVKGLPESVAQNLGQAVSKMINIITQVGYGLDLRRMHRILITTDFAGELAQLSSSTASGNSIQHTDEEYANAVGKVLLLPDSKGYEILPVFDAHIFTSLTPEDWSSCDSADFQMALHLLHHELCHVHHDNKFIDAFPELVLRATYAGKEAFIRPLAEICWEEYIANFMSLPTAPENWLVSVAENFSDAISRTKQMVDSEILAYRTHHNLDHLLQTFQRHGEFLVKMAAYTLGYIDGLGMQLPELSPTAAERLSGSYFEAIWRGMRESMQEMKRCYPDGWKELSVYDNLANVLDEYYITMGLILSTLPSGEAYVHIPFRPETTPRIPL